MNILKKTTFFFILLLSFSSIAQETITNESVIQMQELGFDDHMIIDKINSSNVKFNASIADLSNLKKAGVSSNVISLIMQKSKHNTKSKTGIYYTLDSGKQKLIQPSVFSGTRTNAAAQKLVSGFINSKQKSALPKAKSNNVIKNNQPEFTFLFDVSTVDVDNMQTQQGGGDLFNWWFRTASSPNEFVLIKLTVRERKNLREIITGKGNSLSSSSGVDPKHALPFSIEEIEGNKFKVVAETLEPGEYAFFYQGQVPGGRSNQSVFDFSIQ